MSFNQLHTLTIARETRQIETSIKARRYTGGESRGAMKHLTMPELLRALTAIQARGQLSPTDSEVLRRTSWLYHFGTVRQKDMADLRRMLRATTRSLPVSQNQDRARDRTRQGQNQNNVLFEPDRLGLDVRIDRGKRRPTAFARMFAARGELAQMQELLRQQQEKPSSTDEEELDDQST